MRANPEIVIVVGILLTLMTWLVNPVLGANTATAPWVPVKLPQAPTRLAVYDFDRDGEMEIITDNGIVVDNYVGLKGVYPEGSVYSTGQFLVVFDGHNVSVYNGSERVFTFPAVSARLSMDGLVVSSVLDNGSVLVVTGDGLFVTSCGGVYSYSASKVYYARSTGNGVEVGVASPGGGCSPLARLPFKTSPIALGVDAGVALVLAKGINGYVIAKVEPSGSVKVYGYPGRIDKVLAYSHGLRGFIVVSGDDTALLGETGSSLFAPGKPVAVSPDKRYILYIRDGYAVIVSAYTGEVAESFMAPGGNVVAFTVSPTALLLSEGTLLVSVEKHSPMITFSAPATVYVGDRFKYMVSVPGYEYKVFIDNEKVPPNGTYVFGNAGPHNIVVVVSVGGGRVTKTFRIYALPRPLDIDVDVIGEPKALNYTVVEVKAIDHLTGKKAMVRCNISYSGHTISTWSWEPVEIVFSNPEEPLKTVCGDNIYYAKTFTQDIISHYSPVVPRIMVSYRGGYTVSVKALVGNKTAPGIFDIIINGNKSIRGLHNPALVRLPGPGNYTIVIKFTPASPVYAKASDEARIVILEAGSGNVTAGNNTIVVKEVSKTVTVTSTVPVRIPVKEKPSGLIPSGKGLLFTIAIAVAALSAGLFICRRVER